MAKDERRTVVETEEIKKIGDMKETRTDISRRKMEKKDTAQTKIEKIRRMHILKMKIRIQRK